MRTVHRLRRFRVVPDCPQPEATIKLVQYGAPPWPRLPHNPPANEITIRARAQSLLSRNGVCAELPDIETARRILASEPSMPAAPSTPRDPSPQADGAAGSNFGDVK